jgi:hypothetical protein
VATFLVLRQVSGLTRDQYAAAQQAASEEARQVGSGRIVRVREGFLIPAKGWAICVFCAESLEDVTAVNEQAGVPFTEVLEAIELRPREEA